MIDKIKFDISQPSTSFLLNLQHLRPRYENIGALNALNTTWLGALYRLYFKRFTFLHKRITIPLWRQLHPKYIKFRILYMAYLEKRKQLLTNPWFSLIKMQDFVSSRSIDVVNVLDASSVVVERPEVYPQNDLAEVTQPCTQYDFPSIYCFNLSDAEVYGGSNLIYHSDGVLCHDLFNVNTDYTSEEMHSRIYINVKKRTVRRLHHDNQPDQIAEAASFLDAASTNYAHWITEILPRIVAFCTIKQFSHIPIMIDAGLHENILESLSMIVGLTRKVITVPSGNGVLVGKLFVTSVAGYVPFMPRQKGKDIGSHGVFSASAIKLMRESIFAHIDSSPQKNLPRKIYLARGQRYRSVSNEDSLKKCLAKVGFESIELESLTFSQQVALLRNAEIVIGPTGAGMANLLFSKQSQSIFILFGKNRETHYFYWSHMTSIIGLELNLIIGKQDHPNTGVHSSFCVDETNLLQALSG